MAIKKTQQKAKKNWGWEVRDDDDLSPNTRTTQSKSKQSSKSTTKKSSSKSNSSTKTSRNITKRQQQQKEREIKKTVKFFGVKGIVALLIIIALFACIGAGSCFVLTRNDCFEIIGQDEIELQANEVYFDQGVKVVEFGKDCQDKVIVETDMLQNADGSYSPQLDNDNNPVLKTYYIIYKVKTFKLSKLATVERIRLISFVENSEEIVVD